MTPELAKFFAKLTQYLSTLLAIVFLVITILDSRAAYVAVVIPLLVMTGVCAFAAHRFWRCTHCKGKLPAPIGFGSDRTDFTYCPYCRREVGNEARNDAEQNNTKAYKEDEL